MSELFPVENRRYIQRELFEPELAVAAIADLVEAYSNGERRDLLAHLFYRAAGDTSVPSWQLHGNPPVTDSTRIHAEAARVAMLNEVEAMTNRPAAANTLLKIPSKIRSHDEGTSKHGGYDIFVACTAAELILKPNYTRTIPGSDEPVLLMPGDALIRNSVDSSDTGPFYMTATGGMEYIGYASFHVDATKEEFDRQHAYDGTEPF